MQDLRIQRVKVLMMLYTSHYFVNNRQRQLLDHTYALSRSQAFDYMTEFNKRLSDKVGIKCTMDVLLPTDDDNANIIIEYNGIIKKLMKEAEKLELDTDAIKLMMRDLLNELKGDIDLLDYRWHRLEVCKKKINCKRHTELFQVCTISHLFKIL